MTDDSQMIRPHLVQMRAVTEEVQGGAWDSPWEGAPGKQHCSLVNYASPIQTQHRVSVRKQTI